MLRLLPVSLPLASASLCVISVARQSQLCLGRARTCGRVHGAIATDSGVFHHSARAVQVSSQGHGKLQTVHGHQAAHLDKADPGRVSDSGRAEAVAKEWCSCLKLLFLFDYCFTCLVVHRCAAVCR